VTFPPAQAWSPAPAEAAPRPLTLVDVGAVAAAVILLLIFSQGWITPIFGEQGLEQAGGVIRAAFFPAYLCGLAILAVSFGDMIKVLARQPVLTFMMLVAVASYAWSINGPETMRRVVALGFTTLAGVALAARFRWGQLAEVMAIAFAILVVASLLFAIAVPRIGVMSEIFPGAWRGVWPEKNALGGNMALFFPAFATAAIYRPKRRWLWWGMAGLSVVLLLLSTSKTSLVAMMLGMAAMAFIALVRRGPAAAVGMSYAAVVVIFAGAAIVLLASNLLFAVLGKDATLTGRTLIWSAVMNQVEHRPWLGYGYGTVWTDEGAWGPLPWIVKQAGFRPQHSHDSWIEQWLWLGLVGLWGWILFWGQTMITAVVAVFREKGAYLALPFVLVYSLISITESVTLTYNDLRWVLFVAIACKLAYPDRLKEG
jgi:O-antigen ligase